MYVIGIDTIKIKTYDSAAKTLSNVHHVPDLKHSLISLGTPKSMRRKYLAEGGVFKVSKGTCI